MRRKRVLYSLLFYLWFVGAGSAFHTASAETPTVIRFAFQDRIGSVIPIVAATKGFFADEGLTVEALRFNSGPACAEALYSGAADIGAMGDTTAIIMTSRSETFAIIASHATGEHRHRIVVRQDSELLTLADLKGKTVGVKKGTSTYGGLLAALNSAAIPQNAIHIIDLSPSLMPEALMAGSIDAFVASEPTPSAAEQLGARELTTLGGLGNEYPIMLLANRDTFLNRPDHAKRFMNALKKAEHYAAEHLEETAEIMTAETGLALTTTRKAMQRHHYGLRLDQAIISSLEQSALFLKKQGIITQLPDFDSVTFPNGLDMSDEKREEE